MPDDYTGVRRDEIAEASEFDAKQLCQLQECRTAFNEEFVQEIMEYRRLVHEAELYLKGSRHLKNFLKGSHGLVFVFGADTKYDS